MPTPYDVKTALINEGTASIERLMIKISRLAGIQGEEFVKTSPLDYEMKNLKILSIMEEEMPPFKKRSFLGIGFNSYHYINYIRFYSTYKSFPLGKDDSIVLRFDNDEEYTFKFDSYSKNMGYMTTNICPISDAELSFMSEHRMTSWKLFNNQKKYSVIGGFVPQRENKQYFSEKGGQELFKKMAQEILASKQLLFNRNTTVF